MWVAPTGWRPADVAARYPRPKTDLAQFRRFDPVCAPPVRYYALFQLLAVVLLLGVMQLGAAGGPWLALCMLLTATTTALWLDARRPGLCTAAELSRLAFLAALLWWAGAHAAPKALLTVAAVYLLINLLWLPFLASDRVPGDSDIRSRLA